MKTELKENKNGLTKKDFVSDQAVRWCPGCGDYVILATMQKVLAQLGEPKENILCVSGIGCSSRLPYYLNTFGIHSLHGRALPTATGAKLANPDLSVWVVTGDGDCMAIGGNHFIHAVRRNVNMNILIFNNKIYGMTKGQSSPTTPVGLKTKTAPDGSIENPFNIGELALGAGATFFARVPDNDPKLMEDVMFKAYHHQGTSVIEVLQNCVIFTDGIHEEITARDKKNENQLILEHGKPMIFGDEKKFGLRVNEMEIEKIAVEEDSTDPSILIHNQSRSGIELHMALARMQLPEFPVAIGIIRQNEAPCFEKTMHDSINFSKKNSRYKGVEELFKSGNTWTLG